jgi:hypothetical protein
MKYQRLINFCLMISFALFFLLSVSQPLFAELRGGRQGNSQEGYQAWQDRGGHDSHSQSWQRSDNVRSGQGRNHNGGVQGFSGDDRKGGDRDTYRHDDWYNEHSRGWDTRYNHNRYYPARGHYVRELPHGYHTSYYHHDPYYFWGGVWYRPYGGYFTVVAPPFGLVVPVLPPFYTTLWVGGIPYYYANDTYYTYYPGGGYVVTDPPKNKITETPPEADWLYSYPSRGQSEQQQADDRYACHRWAVDQTGFDPTLPLGGVPESQATQKRNDYQRALGACLEGRGYNVK